MRQRAELGSSSPAYVTATMPSGESLLASDDANAEPIPAAVPGPRDNSRPWRERLERARSAWLKIIGAPDYAAYVEHVRRHHPLAVPMSEREYVRAFFERRGKGGMRCC